MPLLSSSVDTITFSVPSATPLGAYLLTVYSTASSSNKSNDANFSVVSPSVSTPPPTSENSSATTSITISPTSGPAGTMISLSGTFSVCGGQVPGGECTEDRFDTPVFLQGGTSMANDIESSVDSAQNLVYQVPMSLVPGKYQFAIQNCFGKGCVNYTLGWFMVTAPNMATNPAINSISPQSLSSSALQGATITIHGSNFAPNGNYVSFIGDGTINGIDGTPDNYKYMSELSSPDGATISFQLPTSSFAYNSILIPLMVCLKSRFQMRTELAISRSLNCNNGK